MVNMPVRVDAAEDLFYHVAFFAKQDIYPGEELTWV